jgi:murein L,D-transpeptidase YafK
VAAAGEALSETLEATPFPQKAKEMVQALLPHLKAYYRQWEEEDLEPYTTYHSRS